jgi:hypothetical protein
MDDNRRAPVRRVGLSRQRLLAGAVVFLIAGAAQAAAQQPATGQGRQGGGGARAGAPVDLTGTWVSVVSEDWRWRMRTPPKGDYASLPLTEAAIQVADAWDPARDTAAGEQCRAYGAAAIMRVPGRVRISWADDNALRIDTEAGTQTRVLRFRASERPPDAPDWQGTSIAAWRLAGPGGRGGGAPAARGGSLEVVTTNLRPGYLRKNGVPYSAQAVVTEYFNRVTDPVDNQVWLIVTTIVEDPLYLTTRFVTSSHFKKVADDAAWQPRLCTAE